MKMGTYLNTVIHTRALYRDANKSVRIEHIILKTLLPWLVISTDHPAIMFANFKKICWLWKTHNTCLPTLCVGEDLDGK